MAEVFRIEIPINVEDNTDPGVNSAQKKMTAFDKQNEKTQKRLNEMNKTKWKVAIEAVDKVTSVISNIGDRVRSVAGRAWSFTVSAVDKVTAPVKSMISVFGKLLGVSSAVSTILGGLTIRNALDASAESYRMQTQLQVSAKNMGIDESGVQRILDKASQIQQTTMYSDDAFTGAAAELATYFEDTDAIIRMMDTVADYAAGMSGGVELSTEEIVDYTTNLAKMTTGAYDAMTKKGFEVTDAQKAILESGTDMEKVAVIEDIIKANWEGMAEAMSNTPTGQMTRLKNSWADISEMIGVKLTPGVTSFFRMLNSKLPAISNLIEGVASTAGAWLEDFMPTLEGWIDTAIEKVEHFGKRAGEVFSSSEFKNADFFGKINIAWNKLIAEPFGEWWDSTGKAWFADKMSSVGEVIGKGISTGFLALLGIDISQTVADGTSVGGAFIEGFKKGFDTEQITKALKEWASNNKEIVIGIGAVVGFNLITGLAGKLNDLTSLFKGKGGSSNSGSGNLGDLITNCTTATVNGSIVNVYGKIVNDGGNRYNPLPSGSGGGSGGNFIEQWIIAKLLQAGGKKVVQKMLTDGGGTVVRGFLTGGGSSAAGAGAGAGIGSAVNSVELANGTMVASGGALSTFLADLGVSLGSGATTAGGAAAIGGASLGGIIGTVLGLGSSVIDIFQGVGKSKEGDKKGAKDEYWSAGAKGGMVAAGAGIGAGIGAFFGGVGAGPGALIGAGIGGVASLFTGDAAGKALSDGTDEGGWLSNAWDATKHFFTDTLGNFFTKTIPDGWNKMWGGISSFFTESIPQWWGNLKEGVSTFFTETIPEKWDEMWGTIGNFFTEDVPYAVGYAVGKIEVFFTETIPDFFGDLWDSIATFFTDTLPTWASGIWNDHIVPFFTESIPEFFTGIWDAISTFFTDTLPTWASGIWNDHIVPFFTETIPNFFSGLWSNIVTFFTDTLPTWASNVWNNNIVPFFTDTIPTFFTNLWNGIVTFFTDTVPTFVSNVWNNNIVPFFTQTIPGFFRSLWDSITGFVTQTIPSWANSIASVVSGWWSSVKGWFSDLWSKVSGAFTSGYNAATGKHAWGGIMNAPHVGMVAEDGPEAIIPLSPSKADRGFDLWMKAGQYLGVRPYAEGDIVGAEDAAPITTDTATSGGGNSIDVKVEVNPQFVIEARDAGFDGDSLIAVIKEHIREMVDDIGDELAERLARIFANMPVKGTA